MIHGEGEGFNGDRVSFEFDGGIRYKKIGSRHQALGVR
jgi:hypothetical protein